MNKKINKKTIAELKKAEARLNRILKTEGFTPEAENLTYCIGEFCVNNGISIEKYNKLIGKKKTHIREGSLLWRLGQIAVCAVLSIALMIPVLLLANATDAVGDFLVGLL